MLNVIRGKVKIRDIYEIYSFIKGNETLLCINLDIKASAKILSRMTFIK